MAKAKEFENILSECFDLMIQGETIESCLARYPRYAAALEPLLKTASQVRLAASLKPSPEFRQRAGNEFQAAIRNLPAKKGGSGFKWQLRWVAPVAIVLVILAGGTGTVAAATNALPDSPLYGVKMAVESVQMTFTFSDQSKTELYARFVDYRVEEIARMAENGDFYQVAEATERMNSNLLAMANLNFRVGPTLQETTVGYYLMSQETTTSPTSNGTNDKGNPPAPLTSSDTLAGGKNTPTSIVVTDKEKLIQRLMDDMDRNLQILNDQLKKAPDILKPALQKAIDVLTQGYQQAINSLG